MARNFLLKLLVLIAVVSLSYSVFWFFKVGQVEKHVNKFVSENSSYVSVGEISVSGFPMVQKITIHDLKFTIPNALVSGKQVVVKEVQAVAKIFSSDFTVTFVEPVTLTDIAGNVFSVEFSQLPQVSMTISGSKIAKFSYQDSGYRILDAEKKLVYGAASSSFVLDSSTDDTDKTTSKISIGIKEIEGFDVIAAYKNAFEKKVIDGIKTGEISVGSSTPTDAASSASAAVLPTGVPTAGATIPAVVASPAVVATPAPVDLAAQANAAVPNVGENAVNNTDVIKGNFSAELEYVLTPIQQNPAGENPQIPTDPTQVQEVAVQYSKVVKITSLEFSNPLYKISVNGEINVFADDNLPSGAFAVKIDKFDLFSAHITAGLAKLAEEIKPSNLSEVRSSDLTSVGLPVEDSYQNFLKKVSAGFTNVSKELASKNAVSTESLAQFDVRREKNIEFLINETSFREILGKF